MHSAQRGVLHRGDGQPSTTSTTQRLLQRSSRRNPATQIRSLRTRAMRNSTMRLSEKRCLHHTVHSGAKRTANLRQTCHSHEESLLPAQSFFALTSTGRSVHELSSSQKRKSGRDMENKRIRFLLERQKHQILAEVRTEIQKHEFQADSDR